VFAGYAGWGPGQLEEEIERSDWIINEPDEREIFTDRPEDLWSSVLTRMGGRFALLARMPSDPSVN
jgi:putative transcriptional regulator